MNKIEILLVIAFSLVGKHQMLVAGLDEDDDYDTELHTSNKDSGESDADDDDDEEEETNQSLDSKMGYQEESYEKPQKKVFVPVFVPEKDKKKMKILNVDRGFYIPGGTQLGGKYKSLKHCMKACAVTPSCFGGDYNPWLHKCYQHSNLTACNRQSSHPQYVHFSKVPCAVTDAPRGHVTLGASAYNGIEEKGIDNLSQCIKKCVNAGGGILPTIKDETGFNNQGCFAIDYDFATHKCFFFGSNILFGVVPAYVFTHCPAKTLVYPSSRTTHPNSNVIHITFCPVAPPP